MPAAADFRASAAFDSARVDSSGHDVGRNVYWRLYAIENVMRVIVHSILSTQIGPNWWGVAVSQPIQQKAQRFRATYTQSPWHSSPGIHDIYYVDLADLNEIMRANSNLFIVVVRDIDQWIARIEQIRLPRNIVAHMNWPNHNDRQRIRVFYNDVRALASHLATSLQLTIP